MFNLFSQTISRKKKTYHLTNMGCQWKSRKISAIELCVVPAWSHPKHGPCVCHKLHSEQKKRHVSCRNHVYSSGVSIAKHLKISLAAIAWIDPSSPNLVVRPRILRYSARPSFSVASQSPLQSGWLSGDSFKKELFCLWRTKFSIGYYWIHWTCNWILTMMRLVGPWNSLVAGSFAQKISF